MKKSRQHLFAQALLEMVGNPVCCVKLPLSTNWIGLEVNDSDHSSTFLADFGTY
jgi:hypothetical protein